MIARIDVWALTCNHAQFTGSGFATLDAEDSAGLSLGISNGKIAAIRDSIVEAIMAEHLEGRLQAEIRYCLM